MRAAQVGFSKGLYQTTNQAARARDLLKISCGDTNTLTFPLESYPPSVQEACKKSGMARVQESLAWAQGHRFPPRSMHVYAVNEGRFEARVPKLYCAASPEAASWSAEGAASGCDLLRSTLRHPQLGPQCSSPDTKRTQHVTDRPPPGVGPKRTRKRRMCSGSPQQMPSAVPEFQAAVRHPVQVVSSLTGD